MLYLHANTTLFSVVMAQKQMLNLEFSWGRWSALDVQGMLEPMQILTARLGALANFIKLMGHPMSLSDTSADSDDGQSVSDSGSAASSPAT